MISAIVLAAEGGSGHDGDNAQEVVVRSLVWLVSAVVAGVVRDVILAAPPGAGLSDIVDQSGCGLVELDDEAARLSRAVAETRCPRLLLLRAGYQLDTNMTEEIDAFLRRAPSDATALVLAAPETFLQRLLPGRAPVVGVIVTRAFCQSVAPRSFGRLVDRLRKPTRLRSRGVRIA